MGEGLDREGLDLPHAVWCMGFQREITSLRLMTFRFIVLYKISFVGEQDLTRAKVNDPYHFT